jgi:hypothetical protein
MEPSGSGSADSLSAGPSSSTGDNTIIDNNEAAFNKLNGDLKKKNDILQRKLNDLRLSYNLYQNASAN